MKGKIRVLLVCTENICRSPMAEGSLRHHLQASGLGNRVKVESAGILTSHPGRRPDKRAQNVAAAAGIKLNRIRARRVTRRDLELSDYIIAMDTANLRELNRMCPPEHRHKLSLLLSYLPGQNMDDVPDPYYSSIESFNAVFDLIDSAVKALVFSLNGRLQ